MRKIVLVALLLAIGVVAWFATRGGAAPAIENAGTPASRPMVEDSPAESASSPAPPRAARTAIPGEPAGPEPRAAPPPITIRVLVLEKSTSAPCVGATLTYHENPRDPRAGTKSVQTDENGHADVPLRPIGYSIVTARHGALHGEAHFDPRREPPDGFRIEVERDVNLRVRAVDARGAARGGIPIAARFERREANGPGNQMQDLTLGRTGATGELAIAHLQTRCPRIAPDAQGRHVVRLAAAYECSSAAGTAIEIDDPPGDPVVVVVPDSGQIEVEAREENGTCPREGGRMVLRAAGGESCLAAPNVGVEPGANGLFAHVPLGRTWQLDLTFHPRKLTRTIDGPRVAGEKVTARVTLPPLALSLTGRALDAERKPIARQSFSLFALLVDAEWSSSTETDAEGRFRIFLEERLIGRSCDRLVMTLGSECWAMAWAPRLPQLAPGENEIGDLVFAALPVLARIRLAGGAPERDVGLHLTVMQQKPESRPSREVWGPARDTCVRRSDERHFEIRGNPDVARLLIRVNSALHLPVPDLRIDVPAPQEIEVSIAIGGSLLAQVLLDEMPAQHLVRLRALRTDLANDAAMRQNQQPVANFVRSREGRHEYRWDKLTPGLYRVEVSLGDAPRPLVTFDDVVVRAGEPTRDARLLPIDLRAHVRPITLKVSDQSGQPIGVGLVHVLRGPNGGVAQAFAWAEQSTLRIVTHDPYLDVGLAAQGYRPLVVEQVTRDCSATLTAGPRLRVRVAGVRPPLPPGYRIVARVIAPRPGLPGLLPGPKSPMLECLRAPIDESGAATCALSFGGNVTVDLLINSGLREVVWVMPRDVITASSADEGCALVRAPEARARS